MELEQICIRRSIRAGFQVVLRMEGSLEIPKEESSIRSFFQRLWELSLARAEEYGGRLKDRYHALTDIKERAQVRMQTYQLQVRCCYEDPDCAAFLCEGILTGCWSGNVGEGYWRHSYVWNLREQTLLPPAQILERFSSHLSLRSLPFPPDGIYPEGESLVLYRNVTPFSPFLERKLSLKDPKEYVYKNKKI